MPPYRPIADRLADHVDTSGGPDACWPWTASRDDHGYGRISKERSAGLDRAHRVAYEVANGVKLGPGERVRHTCDNPPCCNPRHLVKGTQRDNVVDCIERGRRRYARGDQHGSRLHPESRPRGEANQMSKLTEGDVLEMRRAYAAGEASQTAVAVRFDISQPVARLILLGRSWAHVGGPRMTPRPRTKT